MSIDKEPLISCLCVTENRLAFMPWLLWNYERQTWANRELIIVDSSATPFTSDRTDVRVVPAPPGTGVAAKRNMALRAAQGEFITWFDDDDWQHPEKLVLLAAALQDEAVVYAGARHGWFVDLATGRCARHRGTGHQPIFNSTGFRRKAILPLRFPEKLRKATDTRWIQALRRRFPGQAALMEQEDLFFWLCHGDNLSNPAKKRRFPQEMDALKALIGDAWGDTNEALDGLRERIGLAACLTLPVWKPPPSHADPPRVTVTIPYYRCGSGIRRAVDSILDQSYPHLRLVVVNDGDPNPPWDILAEIDDPRMIRLDLEMNQGRYFVDAVVIEATEDPYYLVQDADDWSDPERLAILMARLKETDAVAAISAARLFRPGDKQGRPYHYHRIKHPPSAHFEFRAAHHGLFRTDVIRALGGYYGGYEIGYDTLLMNLLQLIGPVAYEERLLYSRLIRRNSLTNSPDTGMRSRRRKQVHRELAKVYAQAYRCYQRYQAGALDQAELVRSIARICRQRLTQTERQLLRGESDRLRAMLSTDSDDDQPTQAEDRLLTLLDDSRLRWDTEWRPAQTTARLLTERLVALRPQRILELGSGSTTALFAAYAASSGASVVTLEHLPSFFYKTLRLLGLLGLADQVDVHQAKIRGWVVEGIRYQWYDYDPRESFDFVFIDGPPKKFDRYGTLFALAPALAPEAEIWLHDGLRQHEQDCIRHWKNDFDFRASLQECGKGVWILRDIQSKRVEEECPTS